MSETLVLLLIPAGFLLAGVAIIFGGVYMRRKARFQQAWPTVQGTIEEMSLERWRTGSGNSGFSISSSSGGSTSTVSIGGGSYYPMIKYAYEVGGQSYTTSNYGWVRDKGLTRKQAEAVLAKYQVGGPVAVYYDPANPATAVLSPAQAGCQSIFLMIFGSVFVAIGLGIFYVAYLASTGK